VLVVGGIVLVAYDWGAILGVAWRDVSVSKHSIITSADDLLAVRSMQVPVSTFLKATIEPFLMGDIVQDVDSGMIMV
jgi:hypothetical protein